MKSKVSQFLIVIVFLAVLIVPVIESDKVGGALSASENRYLTKFPSFFSENNNFSLDFFRGFETWLSDNLGGRERVITISKTIDFRIFGLLGFSGYRVIEGPNGWLFYAPNPEIRYIVNSFIPSDFEKKDILVRLEKISERLSRSGTALVVSILPPKFTVYPEELPSTVKLINQTSAVAAVDEELKNAQGFSYASPLSDLIESKSIFPTYSRSYDVGHWNQFGAFIGYSHVMNAVKEQIPDIRVLTEEDFSITRVDKELSAVWGYFSRETDLQYEPKFTRTASDDPGFFDRINFTSKDTWKSYRYFTNPDTKLPKTIVVGDSYVWQFLLQNMAESFSELVFVHYLDLDQVARLNSILSPDVVILMGQGYPAIWALSQLTLLDLSAEIVSHDTPTTIKRGESYNINIVVKNTGDTAWSEDDQIRLCIFQDGKDFGYRINLPAGVKVDPGQEYTFVLYNFRVNDGDSTYLEFQMIKEGYQFFGEKERVDIAVE